MMAVVDYLELVPEDFHKTAVGNLALVLAVLVEEDTVKVPVLEEGDTLEVPVPVPLVEVDIAEVRVQALLVVVVDIAVVRALEPADCHKNFHWTRPRLLHPLLQNI